MTADTNAAIQALKARGLAVLPPLAIVLGTGLGSLADAARNATAVAYPDIPGFPIPTVEGHAGRLVVGDIEGRRVALFQGRGHYYERGDPRAMAVAIETFRALGGDTLILTNAAGGLNKDWPPPSLVAITDHINFSGMNPSHRPPGQRQFRALDPRLRQSTAVGPPRGGKCGERRAQRGGLHVVLGPELRDAGRDPRRAHPRRRPRRHVDCAGSHPRPTGGPALCRGLRGHQFRRRPRRRRSEPRRDAGICPPRRRPLPATAARLHPRLPARSA